MIIPIMSSIWKIQAKISGQSPDKRRQEIIKALLKNRGLITKKLQQQFLNPPRLDSYSIDSVGIKKNQLVKAIKRINQAITSQELIYIYGDYDTDGICSTAVLWEALYYLGAKVMPYIPVRGSKARGLSEEGIKNLDSQPGLIITVDNGISAFAGCQYARRQGIDVIISDHHQPKTKKGKPVYPDALAIIHTIDLAGVGVAWFFSQQIIKLHSKRSSVPSSMELAAIGTIADMVPLIGFNRSLVKQGLKQLIKTVRPGLQILAVGAGVDFNLLQTYDVSFRIAPRLNSMGRLETSMDALRLLCTNNRTKAKQLSQSLDRINQVRKEMTTEMFFHARDQWLKQQKKASQPAKIIFVSHRSYHEGVVGLVASRLVKEFGRPAVVVAIGKDQAKASARSIKGFDVIATFRQMENLFLELGGHQLAAGFTAETKKLPAIQKKLQLLAGKQLLKKKLQPTVEIDCEIKLADITWSLFDQLERFQPFGFANFDPVFATKKIQIIDCRTVGKDHRHLKLKIKQEDSRIIFSAVAFNFGDLSDQLKADQLIDIVYTINNNQWGGRQSLELKINEINF